MTVPVQRGSMAILQPPRSRFMITDILAGSGGGVTGQLSPSPQPRDLSVPAGGGRHHHNNHHHDSDSDSSGQLDDQSVCSNGEFLLFFWIYMLN